MKGLLRNEQQNKFENDNGFADIRKLRVGGGEEIAEGRPVMFEPPEIDVGAYLIRAENLLMS